MRTITFFLSFILSGSLFAQQELTGAIGLTFGMSQSNAIVIMSKKGTEKKPKNPDVLFYERVQIGTRIADAVKLSFIHNKLHTIECFFDPGLEAKAQDLYDEMYNLLSSKYGVGRSFRDFESPYEDGDGYEMQAIRLGKGTIVTYWTFKNNNIMALEIIALPNSVEVQLAYQDDNLIEEATAADNATDTKEF